MEQVYEAALAMGVETEASAEEMEAGLLDNVRRIMRAVFETVRSRL